MDSILAPNNSLKGLKKVNSPTPDKKPPQNEKAASNRNSNPPPNTNEGTHSYNKNLLVVDFRSTLVSLTHFTVVLHTIWKPVI